MTPTMSPQGRWSLSLTGRFAQFNLSLLLFLVVIVVLFNLCVASSCALIAVGGPILLLGLLLTCVLFALHYYSKQEARPDGQTSTIELHGSDGQSAIIRNPPDSFFLRGQSQELVRAIVLGYDSNLCPDGHVIGKAADQKYELYSDAEKEAFKAAHQGEIRGKREQATRFLEQGEPEHQFANQTSEAIGVEAAPHPQR